MRQKNSNTIATKVEHKAGAATMSRIVQCPKCRVLLQEPPPGNPYYQCGSCSTTLQAKHATKADLESTNIRFNQPNQGHRHLHNQQVDLQSNKGSKSDSSSGEISERVGDDYPYGGDGSPSWSPHRKEGAGAGIIYGRIRAGGALAGASQEHFRASSDNLKGEIQFLDQGGRGYNNMATNHHQPTQQTINYDMVDRPQQNPYGSEYGHRRTLSAAAGERYPSPSSLQETSSYGSSGFSPSHHQPMQAPRAVPTTSRVNTGRGDVESEALRAHQPGGNFIHHHQELQRTHSDPVTASEQQLLNSPSLKTAAGRGAGEPPSASSTSTLTSSSSSAASSGRTSKLKWQTRPEPVENPLLSSPRAVDVVMSSRGIVDDDRITCGLSQEDRSKETSSVTERSWRDLPSRRRGKQDDIRTYHGDEQQQHNLQRTQSEESDKNFDNYDSPSARPIPDYDARETASTLDEGEGNDGGGNLGHFSPPPALHLPDFRGGIPRGGQGQSRPNLPRSNVPSCRASSHSDDAKPQTIRMPTELDSSDGPNPHLDKVNRTNCSSPGNVNSPVPSTESALRKSSSDDYANMITEQQHERVMHSRISSDPTPVVVYQQQQQQVDQHHQWVTRLKQQQPPRSGPNSVVSSPKGSPSGSSCSRPPMHGQWDRSSSGSNLQAPPHVEPNPLPTSQLSGSHSGATSQPPPPPSNHHSSPKPIGDSSVGPGGQLPRKQENYPPLPPPGALPHVVCQHCQTILFVPVSLPPPKKNNQRLRCASCMKISTFSVQQPSVEPSYSASRSDVQYGQSSPDAHESSSTLVYRTTSGRSLSAAADEVRRNGRRFSDLSEKSLPITRNNSMGSADMPSDEEIAESTRVMKIDGHSHSNPAISTSSESHHPSEGGLRSYSDGHSPSTSEYKSRFSRGPSLGPLYPKRGTSSLEHGPGSGSGSGSGSSSRHQTEERPHFAANNRPSSRRHEEGVTSSDSESEHPQTLPHGSPQMDDHHSYSHNNSRSPQHHVHSPPMPASGPGEHSGKEQTHHEHHSRSFNKALKGIKTSLRELTHKVHKDHTNQVRTKVTVNGVAIPDNVVKRAEEKAGVILPGNYWYDEQAGFWGVQGGQCEGIIPPHIEEFHYPMSRDCAGGRTGVLVNGRELHTADLAILVTRGLPHIPGRAYRIDIDGRVVNETTGEELRGLGRLAPSLEHTRRRNGMHTR